MLLNIATGSVPRNVVTTIMLHLVNMDSVNCILGRAVGAHLLRKQEHTPPALFSLLLNEFITRSTESTYIEGRGLARQEGNLSTLNNKSLYLMFPKHQQPQRIQRGGCAVSAFDSGREDTNKRATLVAQIVQRNVSRSALRVPRKRLDRALPLESWCTLARGYARVPRGERSPAQALS